MIGFIGGSAFCTKKNYKGQQLDSLWSKQVFDAFEQDDEELVGIALRSSIADLDLVVTGGKGP